MKWIIYILLLLNIAVFAWHYRPGESTAKATTDLLDHEEAVMSLVLLQERQTNKEKKVKSRCYSLGPFEDKEQAGLVEGLLKSSGIKAKRRISKDARRKAYWVLLPPAASKEEAQKSITKLKQLKVDDYFMVVTGEKINAISLGVYSKFESAHRRIKEMQDLGFKPEFEKVELPKREYWWDWPRDSGKSLNAQDMLKVRNISNQVRQIERECS